MSELKPKGKGPRAVIEMEPAEEEFEQGELEGDLEGEPLQEQGSERGAEPPAAAKATMGFVKRLGWRIWNYSEENPNTVFYTLVGLAFAILILTLGIWRALVIGVCMAVGAIYGQVRDGKNGIVNFFIDLIEGNSK